MITEIEKERSLGLIKVLNQKIIDANGVISFADYMNIVLYHPTFGYYENNAFPLSGKGDFITAPQLSPLFASCLAKECGAVLSHMGSHELIEFGAGGGQLAVDLMKAFEAAGITINRYIIIEVSELLRKKQATYIKKMLPQYSEKFVWLSAMPADFYGVVIANEVLDALPCHTFSIEAGQFFERGVTMENGQLAFKKVACLSKALSLALTALQENVDFTENYSSEINLYLAPFLKQIADSLNKGIVIFIDYGYGQQEYYRPSRTQGTLSCFHQHHYHSDPFKMPGLQDITAHVDFTQVAECALSCDLQVEGYTSQASFLLGLGLIEIAAMMETSLSQIEQFELHQAIKRLTFPMEMGETIKVMALSKGFDGERIPFSGFRLKDRRGEL